MQSITRSVAMLSILAALIPTVMSGIFSTQPVPAFAATSEYHWNYEDDHIENPEDTLMYEEGGNKFQNCIDDSEDNGEVSGDDVAECEDDAFGFTLKKTNVDFDDFKDTKYWDNGGNDFEDCIEDAEELQGLKSYEVFECFESDFDE
jgi:hypothetical protein